MKHLQSAIRHAALGSGQAQPLGHLLVERHEPGRKQLDRGDVARTAAIDFSDKVFSSPN